MIPIFINTRCCVLGKIPSYTQCSYDVKRLPSLRNMSRPPRGVLTWTSSLLQICGIPGDQPCATAACGGALCRDSHGLRQCGGPDCTGALPLSSEAFRKAEETAVLLNNLTAQLQEPENQVLYIKPTFVQLNGWRMRFGRSQIYKNSPALWTEWWHSNGLCPNFIDLS